jgi:hypothetical protein
VIKGDCTLLDRERFGRWKSAGKIRSSRPSRVASEGGDLAGGTVGCQRNWRWGQCWREFLPLDRRRINEMGGHKILVWQI